MHKTNGKQIARAIGKGAVRAADSIVNLAALSAVLALFAYGCYGLWDANRIYKSADSGQFEIYKPTDKDGALSFDKLVKLNPDVLGWLSVYGTGIDYPLVQGEDNQRYLHTDVRGDYFYSGSIFLDFRNDRSFRDYNTLIHGHHMEKNAMFGDLGAFEEEAFFDGHRYGNLYYEGKDHGLEFFAFLHADAYDWRIYRPGIEGEEEQAAYLRLLYDSALYVREAEVTPADRLVVLSTCASGVTNNRSLLVGRITDETYPDGFQKETEGVDKQKARRLPVWVWYAAGVSGVLAAGLLLAGFWRKKRAGEEEKEETEEDG